MTEQLGNIGKYFFFSFAVCLFSYEYRVSCMTPASPSVGRRAVAGGGLWVESLTGIPQASGLEWNPRAGANESKSSLHSWCSRCGH